MKASVEQLVSEIKQTVGDKKVICGLSGGVDSSVCAVLVHKAIGDNLVCVFVDHGLMRQNEPDEVEKLFKDTYKMNFIRVNAADRFLGKLSGVSEPEQKRKIIGAEFIAVFDEEAAKIGQVDFLLQGTIYPDIVESGDGKKGLVKSHHNVGGLPENMKLKLLEPLRLMYKDEVRELGEELGMPKEFVWRQPFPGPGLGVRVLGEITKEKLDIVRASDAILRAEIAGHKLNSVIWQYFTFIPGVRSVGVVNGERTYGHAVGIRAVTSKDAMTADWARIPYEVLEKVSTRITAEVPGVTRVIYDITPKPPATIEWE